MFAGDCGVGGEKGGTEVEKGEVAGGREGGRMLLYGYFLIPLPYA